MDCESLRCELRWTAKNQPALTQRTKKRQIARLKRCFKALNDGQMVNPIEVMTLLSEVSIYVDVAKYLNCDKSKNSSKKKV